jgi:hypothetical protein
MNPDVIGSNNLHEAVERLEAEIGEIHDRLDFHERLLERQRDADRLGGDV